MVQLVSHRESGGSEFSKRLFRPYDLSHDDQKFLMVLRRGSNSPIESITIVTHWFDEVRVKMKW